MINFLKNTLTSLYIAFFLFIVLNLASYLYLMSNQNEKHDGREYFISNDDEIKILNTLYPDFQESHYDGPLPHTSIDFVETNNEPSYKVGIEGIRYQNNWDDQYVKKTLSGLEKKQKPSTFVIGGSTAFGANVGNDSTLSAHLNHFDKNYIYLNLGTSAYDSIREVNRLIYLLKKGYRPKNVIFIDGLNDISNFGRSLYNIHDTPNMWGFFNRKPSDVQIVSGYFQERNSFSAYLKALPVMHFFRYKQFHEKDLSEVYERHGGDFVEPNLLLKLREYYLHWPSIRINWKENLSRDIIDHYKQTIQFTESLGHGFGFSVYFVYQPIGLLDKNNPFIKPSFTNSNLYQIYEYVDSNIKSAISNGNLGMRDCSRAFANKTSNHLWVDVTHYSPKGNLFLAKCILNEMGREN
jgi:hypothetical protein